MTTRKDVLLLQIMNAFSAGCGGVDLEDAAAEWFHQRYYDWIDTPRKDPRAGGRRPQDASESEMKELLVKFREIGQKATSGGGTVTSDALQQSAKEVEGASDCPWCPIVE